MMIELQVKKLRDGAKIPTRGSEQAAGYDLYACLEDEVLTIAPHTTAKIPTGLAVAIPDGYFGAVFARSGLGCKYGIALANGVGVIDSDYRGEIKVGLINLTDTPYTVAPGQRIAQLMISKCETCVWHPTEMLSDTIRGEKGHGSTGTV